MRRTKKNNLIILGLCCLLVLMGIGYAAFSSQLNITGTSNITSNFKVLITGVETGNIVGEASNKVEPTFTDDSADISASLTKPGDSISYEITVENKGSIDAVIDSIKINAPDQDVFIFSITGINSKEELLQNEKKTFTVTVKYNENINKQPDITEVNFEVKLEYLQKGNSTNFSDADSIEVEGFKISDLEVNPNETSVTSKITAENAIKYYFSLNNDKWYETNNNSYTIHNLKPNTEYMLYVKAENEEGEVVFSSTKFKTLDKTKPKVLLVMGDNIKGENNWYKGLDINVEVSDNDKVAKASYCIGNSDCTPDKELELTDNKGMVQITSNKYSQKVCVKAVDVVGNEEIKCTDNYNVDSNIPEVTNVIVTPDDDTMTIEVDANDKESGVSTYYYSKDGGKSYVETSNPNYTFTTLEEGDYLVTVYVKDKAGNISETMAKTTTIRHAAFCEHNDIDNFGDCIIASEAKESNIELAKQEIEAKGTPDFNVTSPVIVYSEVHATTTSTHSHGTYDNIATGYTFNSNTGYYYLTNYSLQDPSTIDYSSGDYYTCTSTATMCTPLFKITGVTTLTDSSTGRITYNMTKYNYTQQVASYDTSNVGLYAGSDNDGTTYYYRGSVGGNYVQFAGKYWRIIRVNGDGTVRLIYDGTSAHANGEASSNRQVGTSAFNSYYNDNAYVGYMYGDTSDNQISEATFSFPIDGLSASTKYYFGTSYTFDKSSNTFKLDGDLVQATLTEYGNKYNNDGYYTCFSASRNASCQSLLHVQNYVSATSMNVKALGWSSTSYIDAHSNENNSSMKTYLDNWYDSNLTSIDNKLSKETTFCNNREVSTYKASPYIGDGYGITSTMYSYPRFFNWNDSRISPSLICLQANDKFSVTTSKGNGVLSKPIGLITADEVSMSGGRTNSQNTLYYLYTGTNYWTMTPPLFGNNNVAYEFTVQNFGQLNYARVDLGYGVRPVINLDTSKITFTGSGTMQDPYVVE